MKLNVMTDGKNRPGKAETGLIPRIANSEGGPIFLKEREKRTLSSLRKGPPEGIQRGPGGPWGNILQRNSLERNSHHKGCRRLMAIKRGSGCQHMRRGVYVPNEESGAEKSRRPLGTYSAKRKIELSETRKQSQPERDQGGV